MEVPRVTTKDARKIGSFASFRGRDAGRGVAMSAARSLAELLRAHRIDASLTIEMLAARSAISDRTISNIERGASLSPQHRTLQALADALDLTPEEARSLYRAGKTRQGPTLGPDRAVSIAPARLPDFTGRECEVQAIVDFFGEQQDAATSKLVIVCGSPGIGKTTTAVEALRRLGDGDAPTLFVDVAGLASLPLTPLQVLQALLRQVQDASLGIPRTLDSAATAWRSATSGGRLLVLLDNAADEEQIRPVLAAGTGCAVVVTSRRSLAGLEAAFRVTLEPLAEEESAQLLGRIIPAAQRTDAELAELARLCADIPLAIRIAGNRIASQPTWTAADFIARMQVEERRLRSLTAGDLGVGAAFTSSYVNLRPELQELYRVLPLIEGTTFDARIAAAIIPGDLLDTEELLDDLTDLGLLEARGSTRYRLHDLARLFALQRQRAETPADLVRDRRANLRHWLTATASKAGRWFEPADGADAPTDAEGLDFLDADSARTWLQSEADSWFPAYLQSHTLGEHARVLTVADSLHWFSDLWSGWGHWHDLFAASAASAVALGDSTAESTHFGYVAWADITELGDYAAAETDALRARDAAERADDDSLRGWARFYLAWARDKLGRLEAAIDDAQRALHFFELAADREGILQSASLLAHAYHHLGSTELAIEAHHRLLEQIESTATDTQPTIDLFTKSSAERMLAEEYLAADRPADAARFAHSSMTTARDIGFAWGRFVSLLVLARSSALLHETSAAESYLTEAEMLAEEESIPRASDNIERTRAFIAAVAG
ncbi:helix-turn-helix domain-containing protein [Leifsonia sp. NPDC058292]|uniref:helix-turn-helix domain-containing protein n=1 Tax=Leifsonia sp. NPDC058292 TaxID=3346428 RepID=UPI0036D7F1E8